MAAAKKEEKKAIKTVLVAGTSQTLSNLYKRLSISMAMLLKFAKASTVHRDLWNNNAAISNSFEEKLPMYESKAIFTHMIITV